LRKKILFILSSVTILVLFLAAQNKESVQQEVLKISSQVMADKNTEALAQMPLAEFKKEESSNAETAASAERTQYETRLSKILEEMPTLAKAATPQVDSDGDIHGFQADELKEAQKLAELRTLSLENEKFSASTQNVYADCSQRSEFSVSVRAVCFMRAMELSIKLKNPQNVVELNVPSDVRQLALKLVN
jgi:hypothetical protein